MANANQKAVAKPDGTRVRRLKISRRREMAERRETHKLDEDLLKTAWDAGQRIASEPESVLSGPAASEALQSLLDRNQALLNEIDRRLKSSR